MRLIILVLLLMPFVSQAQYKNYKLSVKGDTLNIIDAKGLKQGKWLVRVEELRGEPGYEEEGEFRDDRKEGVWRRYNLTGDLVAVESYRWGMKDGICRYFTIMGEEHQESWRAINPDKEYDTVEVPDPIDPYKVTMVAVKVEGRALRHGTWRFYDPASGAILRTETWFMDKKEDPNKKLLTGTSAADSTMSIRKKLSDDSKPKEVKEYDKKNSGKKKYNVREGRTGY